MRAALVVLAVAAAAVAVPLQWLELEKAQTITKGSRLGDIYTLCSECIIAPYSVFIGVWMPLSIDSHITYFITLQINLVIPSFLMLL